MFDENCPSCIWDEAGVRWVRVGIRNTSLSTVNDVVVSLEDVKPNPDRKLQLPMALKPKDDRSEHGQPLTLHPGGEGHAHIDFFAQAWDENSILQINFGPQGVPRQVEPGDYVGT